jgi:zinc protease
LLADLVLHPTFPEEELERQRKRRLDSILQERHNPPIIARKVFRSVLFGSQHPYGRELAGNEASIVALSRADLNGFYETFWKPNHAALIFAGDITLDEATGLADDVLGAWQIGEVPEVSRPPVSPPSSTRIYLVDRQDAAQSQIRIGSIGPKRKIEDYYAVELMNAILGGAFTSRLNLNLREDKGYTYGAFSGFSYGRQLGLWACGASVQTRFSKEAVVEFHKELRGICGEKPITLGELETAKVNLTRGFAQRFETLGRVVDQAAEMVSHTLPLEEITEYPHAIEEITLEQAQAAAQKYIDPTRVVIVIVGDLKQIETGVQDLDIGSVITVDVEGRTVQFERRPV